MGVSRVTITGNDYYRVCRKWGGKEFQRYFSVKPNPDKAWKAAQVEDENLAQRQRAFRQRRLLTKDYLILKNGRVRGIQSVKDHRYPNIKVYRVQIRVPWHQTHRTAWFSVNRYGDHEAFRRAVQWLCGYIGIDGSGELAHQLFSSYPNYRSEKSLRVAIPDEDLEAQLTNEINDYKKKRKTS